MSDLTVTPELPLEGGKVPSHNPRTDGPMRALAYSADFPSRTMTFHVPRGTAAVPGIYTITYLRHPTPEEFNEYANLPDPFRCPECDARGEQ